jgi:hypothetical protein
MESIPSSVLAVKGSGLGAAWPHGWKVAERSKFVSI